MVKLVKELEYFIGSWCTLKLNKLVLLLALLNYSIYYILTYRYVYSFA